MAKASPKFVLSHWYYLLEGLQASPLDFYAAVEQAVARRQVPGVSLSRVDYREGGIFSAHREYLRVQRKKLVFDICGAPFGPSFFVSWWLGELRSRFVTLLLMIPILGLFVHHLLLLWETYYQIDTALMFQEAVRGAVMDVLDELSKAQGLRILSPLERKPILRELARR